jgi:recombination protein RecT
MCITAEALLKTHVAFDKINEVLSNATDAQKFLILARLEISKSELLRKCDGNTLLGCLVKVASLRLFIGNGDAYLVPYKYKDKDEDNDNCKLHQGMLKQRYHCQLQIGYQGMLKLMYRGGLKSIKANVAYSNDSFEFLDGTETSIKHIRTFGDRGNLLCAYCVANINGENIIEIMDKNEIDMIRSRSPNAYKKDYPWDSFYDEMAKKTVIRRIFKKLPQENFDAEVISTLRDDENLLETANTNVEYVADASKSDAIAAIL